MLASAVASWQGRKPSYGGLYPPRRIHPLIGGCVRGVGQVLGESEDVLGRGGQAADVCQCTCRGSIRRNTMLSLQAV